MADQHDQQSVSLASGQPAGLPCPGEDFALIPDVASLQDADGLRELGITRLPLVDGVGIDVQHLPDLGGADEVSGIDFHDAADYEGRVEVQWLPGFAAGVLESPSETSYSADVAPAPHSPKIDEDADHPSATAARAAWEDDDSTPHASGTEGSSFWKLYSGDSASVLGSLPRASVNCVVTSPPYYWQRDYEVDGQFGMEPTIDGFVENLRRVFQRLRDVLRPDGVVFMNLGDTYYSAKGRPHGRDAKHRSRRLPGLRAVDGPGLGLPRKSMIGIPWRVALGLQEDGWTLRSDIIWVRNSAVPEPTAKDRPWRKHEHIFLFSQQPRYFFDREALKGEEDVWFIEPDRNAESRGAHYAPYPKELVERCVLAGCPEGGVVLDPFVGGGTTMYESLELGRSAVGVDLSPAFCSLIEKNLDVRASRAPLITLDDRRPKRRR